MDCIVAIHFFHLGAIHGVYHYWYFGLTVTFVLLPSLTMTGFSLRWYLNDAENLQLPPVPTWKWILRIIVLLFQVSIFKVAAKSYYVTLNLYDNCRLLQFCGTSTP